MAAAVFMRIACVADTARRELLQSRWEALGQTWFEMADV